MKINFRGRIIEIEDKLVEDFRRIMHEELDDKILHIYTKAYTKERPLSEIPENELNNIIVSKIKFDLELSGEYEES